MEHTPDYRLSDLVTHSQQTAEDQLQTLFQALASSNTPEEAETIQMQIAQQLQYTISSIRSPYLSTENTQN